MRFAIVALIMVLASHVLAQEAPGLGVEPSAVEGQNTKERRAEDRASDTYSLPVRIVEDPQDARRAREREDKADANQDADLVEQRRAADAATRGAASSERQENFAVFQLVVAGVGAFLVLVAVGLAFSANSIARQTGRDQTRAYVHVEQANLTWGNMFGSNPAITLTAKNTGQTPAKWFGARYRVFVRALNADGTAKEAADFRTVDLTNREFKRWNALGTMSELAFAASTVEDIEIMKGVYKDRDVSINIAGTIRYETFFGEIFETDFWFVRRRVPEYSYVETSRVDKPGVTNTEGYEKPRKLQRTTGDLRTFDLIRKRRWWRRG